MLDGTTTGTAIPDPAEERRMSVIDPGQTDRDTDRPVHAIWDALQWAFAVECAETFDPDDRRISGGRGFRSVGIEAVLAEKAALGDVRIDTSPGRSWPADDADRIATALSVGTDRRTRRIVEDHARWMWPPDWMPGARGRLVPLAWSRRPGPDLPSGLGRKTKVGSVAIARDVPHPRNPARTIRRVRREDVFATPASWETHPDEIRAARAEYDLWWFGVAATLAVIETSGVRLDRFDLSDRLPPFRPWIST